jgi:hypothetical protein
MLLMLVMPIKRAASLGEVTPENLLLKLCQVYLQTRALRSAYCQALSKWLLAMPPLVAVKCQPTAYFAQISCLYLEV